MKRQILCVDRNPKDNTIIGFGGRKWGISKDEAYAAIKNNKCSFYVEDKKGNAVDVIVIEEHDGSRHFRTTPDESKINNLESLPSCEDYRIESVASHISKQLK